MARNFTLKDCVVRYHQQICWNCAKACGGGSWSKDLEPVHGWVAQKIVKPDPKKGIWETYKILSCPEFEREART